MAKLVPPTGDIKVKCLQDLNEDPAVTPEKLKQLKEWLAMQPHLPTFNDDQRLTTFLRGCKFSMEKAKSKLDMYFSMRTAVPEFFSDRDPFSPEIQKVWEEVQMTPLLGLTPDGNRVIWMTSTKPELDITSATVGMKLTLMIGDLRLDMEQGISGDVYVFDAAYATPSQFAKFTPALIKKFLVTVQEAYPVRLRQIHIINVTPFADVIFNFVKPFLKDKIKDRIHFHGNKGLDSLYKFIPQEMIPSDCGGKAESLAELNSALRIAVDGGTDHWLQFLQKCSLEIEPELIPEIIIGDLDSVQPSSLQKCSSKGSTVIKHADQDTTDFFKALTEVDKWQEQNNTKLDAVIAMVETSGRLDHILANLNTLFLAESLFSCPVYQLASNSLSWLLKPGNHTIKISSNLAQRHCSLVPLGAPSSCVSTTGLKWNLNRQKMGFGGLISTSNAFEDREGGNVSVSTDSTLLWTIQISV